MIRIEGVSKRFGGTVALENVSLSINAGEIVALIGPSGCGKSTLLRILTGLITPDTGSLEIEATPLTPATLTTHRERLGYVIQDGGLFPHLTARQNVTLMADHLAWSSDQIAGRLAALSALTHVEAEQLDRFPLELSGGQRQRIALMRALMLDPDLLLLDEPLGALDPMIRASLQRDLKEIFQALGKTVVLVTHDLHEAAYFADRIVLIRNGTIVEDGSLAELTSNPADPFVSEFLHAQRALSLEGENA